MAVVFFSTQIVIIMYLIQRSCRIRCKGEFKKGYSLNKIEHNNNNNNNSIQWQQILQLKLMEHAKVYQATKLLVNDKLSAVVRSSLLPVKYVWNSIFFGSVCKFSHTICKLSAI